MITSLQELCLYTASFHQNFPCVQIVIDCFYQGAALGRLSTVSFDSEKPFQHHVESAWILQEASRRLAMGEGAVVEE